MKEKAKDIFNYLSSSKAWEPDAWGHLQKEYPTGRRYRLKFQETTIRKEVRIEDCWVRVTTYNINKMYANLKSKQLIK